MGAFEVDGSNPNSNSSTHIYCKPVKVQNAGKVRNTVESGESNGQSKTMPSKQKVPSSLVAIDVNLQPFNRMSNFRWSLIHVNFMIGRKRKKDKRRNTVAESDVKELKDALQKIVNDETKYTRPESICSCQQMIEESKSAYAMQEHDNQMNDKMSVERKNNIQSMAMLNCINSSENDTVLHEKVKNDISYCEENGEIKAIEAEIATKHSSSKRKHQTNIPISTISAAMNVAVKMRQRNGVTTEMPVLNGNYQKNSPFDSDKLQDNRNLNSSYNADGSEEENWTSYRKRLQEKCRSFREDRKEFLEDANRKEMEDFSSASSEITDLQESITTMTTESDAFFISSDESDDEELKKISGSLSSLDRASNGSLNSLLSETEMISSTETLSSIGREHATISPPPPPPMILSATFKDNHSLSGSKCFDAEILREKKSAKAEIASSKPTKQIPIHKLSKSPKHDLVNTRKKLSENSNNIFSTLVNLKSHTKEEIKNKHVDTKKKKLSKIPHVPTFDMYGNNSPAKATQIPAFIKENFSPVQSEGNSHLKSFLVSNNSFQPSKNEITNKSKSETTTDRSIPYPRASDTNKTQTVNSIPQKYEHQVIVKPVQRCSENENKSKIIDRKTPTEKENQQHFRYCNKSVQYNENTINQTYGPRVPRCLPQNTFRQERSKAARVVLDFDGKVIYSTNSLDRKYYNTNTENMYNTAQVSSCDRHFKDLKFNTDNNNYNSCHENYLQQNFQISPNVPYKNNGVYHQDVAIINSPHTASLNYNTRKHRSEDEYYLKNENDLCRLNQTYHPHFPVYNFQNIQNHKSENIQSFQPKRMDIRPHSSAENYSDAYLRNNILSDPNISGLPVPENLLTKHNVTLHSRQMEKMSRNSADNYNRFTHPSCITPTTQINTSNKSPQSTMSTEDLFVMIHNCKKRMNIKTDSDISLPSSSRSSSPSFLRPSTSKGSLVETGFLSPRSQVQLEASRDRKSWADFRPVSSICNERKSLASDRLGPTKPTSMHDFKMLLLQARTSSQISGPRKSAVEMLKVPVNKNSTEQDMPSNFSSRNYMSMSVQNSPTTDLNLYNGHSTVPFKRGNKARASLQPRYIIYPPIFEDCSEDSENCTDSVSNKSSSTVTGVESKNVKENPDWKFNPNNNLSDQDMSCDSGIKLQPD